MRHSDPPVQYLVGTPKGRLSKLEKHLLGQPWQQARPGVEVKLLRAGGGAVRLCAEPRAGGQGAGDAPAQAQVAVGAVGQTRRPWSLSREQLLMKLGAARAACPGGLAAGASRSRAPASAASATGYGATSCARCAAAKGRYLLRTNLTDTDPAKLWEFYMQLVAVEEAFRNLKGDLALRPIFHQHIERDRGAHLRRLSGLLPARDAWGGACMRWPRG